MKFSQLSKFDQRNLNDAQLSRDNDYIGLFMPFQDKYFHSFTFCLQINVEKIPFVAAVYSKHMTAFNKLYPNMPRIVL